MPAQKIAPHLWFDKGAKDAAEFYVSAFGGSSKLTSVQTLHDTPSGSVEIVSFELDGYRFMGIAAGPLFKFNPSISFMVNFDPSRDDGAREHLDALWQTLSQGGTALMPLQEYPFSKRYGWIEDKYGLSWQLILTDPAGEPRSRIIPSLLFVGNAYGRAEDALDFYVDVFRDSRKGTVAKYGPGQAPDREGALMFGECMLEGQWFAAMDSAREHNFGFNEAISLMVSCKDQDEIDYYWKRLSAVPEAEQCGWLKDRFGVSWQIVPTVMDEMMTRGTPARIARVTQAFLKMKKFDIATLQRAYAG